MTGSLVQEGGLALQQGDSVPQQQPRFRSVFDLWIVGTGAVVAGDMMGWTPVLVVGVGGACLVVLGMTLFFFALGMCVAELAASPLTAEGGTAAQLVKPFLGSFFADACTLGETLKLVCGTAVCAASFSAYVCDAAGLPEVAQLVGWVVVMVLTTLIAFRGETGHSVQIFTTLFSLVYLCVFYVSAAVAGTFGEKRLSELAVMTGKNDDDMAADFTYRGTLGRVGLSITTSAWFLLGSEGLPLAAPMCAEPKQIPKAIYLTIATTGATALLTVLASAAVATDEELIEMSSHPLLVGFKRAWGNNGLAGRLGSIWAVVGVGASLNAFFYYTVQLCREVMADAGVRTTTTTDSSKTDVASPLVAGALILVSMFVLVPLNGNDPDQVLNCLVWLSLFGAATTYVVQFAAFLEMRRSAPQKEDDDDHWKSPLGSAGAVLGAGLNLVFLASLVVVVADIMDYRSGGYFVAVIFGLALAGGLIFRRHTWASSFFFFFLGKNKFDNDDSALKVPLVKENNNNIDGPLAVGTVVVVTTPQEAQDDGASPPPQV